MLHFVASQKKTPNLVSFPSIPMRYIVVLTIWWLISLIINFVISKNRGKLSGVHNCQISLRLKGARCVQHSVASQNKTQFGLLSEVSLRSQPRFNVGNTAINDAAPYNKGNVVCVCFGYGTQVC